MQLFGENLRQVLGFGAHRKGFAEAKHSFIASSVILRLNVSICAHLVFGSSDPCVVKEVYRTTDDDFIWLKIAFRVFRNTVGVSRQLMQLGRFRRRVPGDDGDGCFPDERSRLFRCVRLFAAAGRDKGFSVQDVRLKHRSSAGCEAYTSSRRPLAHPFIGCCACMSPE